MFSRIGRPLILVTVITAILLVFLPPSGVPLSPGQRAATMSSAEVVGGQVTVISLVLSSYLVSALTYLFFAASGKKVATKTRGTEANGALTYTRFEGGKALGTEQLVFKGSSSGSLGTIGGVPAPPGKGLEWGEEFSLTGSTLKMYWSLLSRRDASIGLRTIQRELGFSSPSSAAYQLDKLMNLGLVSKDEMGDYVVNRVVKVGFLRDFLFLGKHALPKNAIYGALTLAVSFVCFSLLVIMQVQVLVVCLAVLPGLISTSLFLRDAAKALEYKNKLTVRHNNKREG
jgi:hypothetical protein